MACKLEYVDEALDEAEAAARWYAERSATAAAAFSEEIDAAESAILRLPEAWPRYEHDTRRISCDVFRSALFTALKPIAF